MTRCDTINAALEAWPDNMPILYRNIMGAMSPLGRAAFLWAVDRPQNDSNCYVAESFAREYVDLVDALTPMLDAAAKGHGQESRDPDLMEFILQRYANDKFGGNIKLPNFTANATT